MAPRLGLLGAERRAEAVDAAERHRVRLVVELTALRQIGGLVLEVLRRKQRRRALAGRRREDRRVGEDEAAPVEEVAHRVDDLVADPQDRLLPLAADPQMPAVEQVIDAVLLRRDGVVVRLADDLEALDVDLVSARRARVRTRRAGHHDRRFLRQMIGGLEDLLAHGGLRHHRLDEARAVAEDEEMDLAARAAVMEPPFDGDLLALVPADVFDVDVRQSFSARRQKLFHPVCRACPRAHERVLRRSLRVHLEDERPLVSDFLHRRQRGGPVDRPLEREEVIVGAPAVVVHVRRDQVLGHGFNRVDDVTVEVGVAEVQADPDLGSGRRRPASRLPRRSARAIRPATTRSAALPRAIRTPSGWASRINCSMLRRAAARVSCTPIRDRRLRPRHTEMRDEHRDGDAPRDVQRPLGFAHRARTRVGSALAIESVPFQRPPLKRSAIGA